MSRRDTQGKQISILGMMILTIIAALFFLYVSNWNVPVARWPLLFLVLAFTASMAKLAHIAIQDTTAKGVRRQYRPLYDRQEESVQADSGESDTMVDNDHVQGADDETAVD